MPRPPVLVLRAAGTNCDAETVHALECAGAAPELVHINEFSRGHRRLEEFQMLVIPGGFTYGDDISAGKILANEMRCLIGESLREFVAAGKLVFGICNGFQVLVKARLLPGSISGAPELTTTRATLSDNLNGRFQCRWIRLKVKESAASPYLAGLDGAVLEMPIAHGEGRFVAPDEELHRLREAGAVALQYCGPSGELEDRFNVNGSALHAAGISSFGGHVLGLMPHPERFVHGLQHPRWTREGLRPEGDGLALFRNAVRFLERG